MKTKFRIVSILSIIVILLFVGESNLNVVNKAFAIDTEAGFTIGGVDVTDLKDDELLTAVQAAVTDWNSEPIIVSGGGTEVTIDSSVLSFDVQASVEDYLAQVDKPWFAIWEKKRSVHIPLKVVADEQLNREIENVGMWNVELTVNQILAQASYLKERKVEAAVEDLTLLEAERIALSMEKIPDGAIGVNDLVAMLDDKVISTGKTLSLLETFDSFADTSNKMAQDFVASLVYHAVLQTNYEVLERHAQAEQPSYLQPGFEASVNKSLSKDLQFKNHSEILGKFRVTIEGDQLKVEITSPTVAAKANPRVETDKNIKPKIIYRYAANLGVNQQKIIQEGKQGLRVIVYRSITESGSSREELIGRDYYPPVNRIVLKSSKILEQSTTTPSGGTAEDPDLQVDLDGNGLPDQPTNPAGDNSSEGNANGETKNDLENGDYSQPGEVLPNGSYYDKGGNLVTPKG